MVMSDDSSSRGTCRKPSLTSSSEKHFAWQSLWSCSFRVGIWKIGLRIALLTVWLGSMQILVFFGVSLMISLEHHEVGSSFLMTPAATYLSRASFSLIRFTTGTRWIGICTGEMSLLTLKWTGGPKQPRPSKFSGYCCRMCSCVSSPGGGRHLMVGIRMGFEGEGSDLSLLGSWSLSCSRWLFGSSLGAQLVLIVGPSVPGKGLLIGALFPVESITAEVRENISSAVILMRPSFSQSDTESRSGLFIMISLESTWNVRVSNVLSVSHRRSICPSGLSGRASP